MASELQNLIQNAIIEECKKLIDRHQSYASKLAESARRKSKRTGCPVRWTVKRPKYWDVDRGFDPYYVRKNAGVISHSIAKKISAGTYAPRPAIFYEVAKPDGGKRQISVFQVADNAVSRIFFLALMKKNASRFGPRCYAYRSDITIHDAVFHLFGEINGRARIFVAEFDFSKYFDRISHDHLRDVLDSGQFCMTSKERKTLEAFFTAPRLPSNEYDPNSTSSSQLGIPQGTSTSLLLANLAAFHLDRKLERLGVGYIRFADDTLIWSDEYGNVCKAVDALIEAGMAMGVEINFAKSEGISILTANGSKTTESLSSFLTGGEDDSHVRHGAEFKGKSFVTFLGHSISPHCVSMSPRVIERLKKELSYIVYSNLVQALKNNHVVLSRVNGGTVDRDYIVMISQLRRYLYGDLSENQLRKFLDGDTPSLNFRGFLSFYPNLNDHKLLFELDYWLQAVVFRALKLRGRLLVRAGITTLPLPHGCSKNSLLNFKNPDKNAQPQDLRLPSFHKIGELIRKGAEAHGPNAVADPKSMRYYLWA